MVSIGKWNQIDPDLQVTIYSITPNITWNSFPFCYHSVNGISYGKDQIDLIKWYPPYYFFSAQRDHNKWFLL